MGAATSSTQGQEMVIQTLLDYLAQAVGVRDAMQDAKGKHRWVKLIDISAIPIRQHIKVRAEANPFDPNGSSISNNARSAEWIRPWTVERGRYGDDNEADVRTVDSQSASILDGMPTTSSGACMVAVTGSTTLFCFIPIAIGRFAASGPLSHDRVSSLTPLKGLSRMPGNTQSPVLRGREVP
jgi:hypothetical protein